MVAKRAWSVWIAGAALAIWPALVSAEPIEQSCRLLDVMANNQADEVETLMTEVAARWPALNRVAAIERLQELLATAPFVDGSVYRTARLGEDLEEHLVVLRLAAGELAGARLLYEWTPTGPALTVFDFKQEFPELITGQLLPQSEPLACP